MALGWQRFYETEAVCDGAQVLKYLAAQHPTDARLQNVARRAQLTAVMIIAREQRDLTAPNANIIADRQTDCRYCDHSPPCARCKYASTAARIDTIRCNIGQEALDCIEQYAKTKGD